MKASIFMGLISATLAIAAPALESRDNLDGVDALAPPRCRTSTDCELVGKDCWCHQAYCLC